MTKAPRQYAYDFLQARTPDAQRAALAGCPVEWRALVTAHIRIWRERLAASNHHRHLRDEDIERLRKVEKYRQQVRELVQE